MRGFGRVLARAPNRVFGSMFRAKQNSPFASIGKRVALCRYMHGNAEKDEKNTRKEVEYPLLSVGVLPETCRVVRVAGPKAPKLQFKPEVLPLQEMVTQLRSLTLGFLTDHWCGLPEFEQGAKHAVCTVVQMLHTTNPSTLDTDDLSHMIGGGLLEDVADTINDCQEEEAERKNDGLAPIKRSTVQTIELKEAAAAGHNIGLAYIQEASGGALFVKVDVLVTARHIHRVIPFGELEANGEKLDLQRCFNASFEGCVRRFSPSSKLDVEYKLVDLKEIALPSTPQRLDDEEKPDEKLEEI